MYCYLLYLMFRCDRRCDGCDGNFENFVGTKHTLPDELNCQWIWFGRTWPVDGAGGAGVPRPRRWIRPPAPMSWCSIACRPGSARRVQNATAAAAGLVHAATGVNFHSTDMRIIDAGRGQWIRWSSRRRADGCRSRSVARRVARVLTS